MFKSELILAKTLGGLGGSMGGHGSGNWWHWQRKKATVEESLSLSVRELKGRLGDGSRGSVSWTWRSGKTSSIGFFVRWNGLGPIVTLHYRWNDKEDVEIPVRVQTTPMHFGGERRWFTCPLIVNGVACNRRCARLHLPGGAKYFGCRKCHGLTYVSCQEAHRDERMMARLGLGCHLANDGQTWFGVSP